MKDPDLCSPSEKISDYAKRRKELRGLSTDEIHGIDSQPNGGYELRLSDIEWQSKRIAELEAQAKASEWQPISTAPKDGSPIILGRPEIDDSCSFSGQGRWHEEDHDGPDNMGHDAGFLDDEFQFFRCARSFGNPEYQGAGTQPTHWMPLPAPPKSTCESA